MSQETAKNRVCPSCEAKIAQNLFQKFLQCQLCGCDICDECEASEAHICKKCWEKNTPSKEFKVLFYKWTDTVPEMYDEGYFRPEELVVEWSRKQGAAQMKVKIWKELSVLLRQWEFTDALSLEKVRRFGKFIEEA